MTFCISFTACSSGFLRTHYKWIGNKLYISISMQYEILWKCWHSHYLTLLLLFFITYYWMHILRHNMQIRDNEYILYIGYNGKPHFRPCWHSHCVMKNNISNHSLISFKSLHSSGSGGSFQKTLIYIKRLLNAGSSMHTKCKI